MMTQGQMGSRPHIGVSATQDGVDSKEGVTGPARPTATRAGLCNLRGYLRLERQLNMKVVERVDMNMFHGVTS